MMVVYAIKSCTKDWIYVGMTSQLATRLHHHNNGYNKSTKPYKPFKLLFTEKCPNTILAREREKYLKTAAGKRWIRKNFN